MSFGRPSDRRVRLGLDRVGLLGRLTTCSRTGSPRLVSGLGPRRRKSRDLERSSSVCWSWLHLLALRSGSGFGLGRRSPFADSRRRCRGGHETLGRWVCEIVTPWKSSNLNGGLGSLGLLLVIRLRSARHRHVNLPSPPATLPNAPHACPRSWRHPRPSSQRRWPKILLFQRSPRLSG